MEAQKQLAYWLGSKRKYRKGVEIFKELGIDSSKNAFFSTQKPTKVHINLLHKALNRYARVNNIRAQKQVDIPETTVKEAVKISKSRPRVDMNPRIQYNDLPDEMKAIYDRILDINKLFNKKSAEIREIPEDPKRDNDRKVLANDILALNKERRKLYDQLDAWYNGSKQDDSKKKEYVKPSGSLSLEEIEKIEDPEIKSLSRQLRIEANLNYLRRYKRSKKPRQIEKMNERKAELDKLGVNYSEILK